MQRYILLYADDPSCSQAIQQHARAICAKFPDWCEYRFADRAAIVASPDTLVSIAPNRRAAIIGQWTSTHGSPRSDALETVSTGDVGQTTSAVAQIWGSFVLAFDTSTEGLCIAREPFGGVSCYAAQADNLSIAFSHLEDALASFPLPLEVDWKFIRRHLVSSPKYDGGCALVGFSEVEPSSIVKMADRMVLTRSYWSPTNFALDPISTSSEAEQLLRAALTESVTGIAAAYSKSCISISGGLDSSIVLGMWSKYAGAAPRTAMTRFLPAAEGDERYFARLVAHFNDTELLEVATGFDRRELSKYLLAVPKTVSPTIYSISYPDDVPLRDHLMQRTGASVLVNGIGGDAMLYGVNNSLPARDRYLKDFISTDLFRTAFSVAHASEQSFWKVMMDSLGPAAAERELRKFTFARTTTYLRDEACEEIRGEPEDLHPWLSQARELPPGKQLQVFTLVGAGQQNPYYTFGDMEVRSPLQSQVLVEAAMRIPTYLLCKDGRTRGLARDAFADVLPQAVAQRMRKGTNASQWHRLIEDESNRTFARELLLDGALAKRGIVDRKQVEAVLRPAMPTPSKGYRTLLNCISTEAWLQSIAA